LNTPERWRFPTDRPDETIIPSHGFLLIWADEDVLDTPGLHADFELSVDNGETIGLYDSDGLTRLDSLTFGKQTTDISYGRDPDGSANWGTMIPTPNWSNTGSYIGLVADTKFSLDRGFYTAPIQVAISCATPGATIFYTTNCQEPTDTAGPANFEYQGPITIDHTTCLRAAAFLPSWRPSNTDTHTYLFLDDVIVQPANPEGFPAYWNSTPGEYGMDPDVVGQSGQDLFGGIYAATIKDDLKSIPTMSIVMEMDDLFGSSGIYSNPRNEGVAWERPGSLELIWPDPDTAPDDGFQVNCGVRIYGGVGRYEQFEKKTFRCLFKGDYGPTKLRYPLFGPDAADAFDTLILRAGFNNSWHRHYEPEELNTQLLRDEWMRQTQLDMGDISLHGTFVHLYVNGHYWGLYNPVERCNADFGASYLGGEKEDYDALNSYPRSVVDGTAEAWITAQSLASGPLADAAGYQALSQYVDIDNLIDYMILNIYAGNIDWDDHNWYAVRRREEGAGWKFVSWDAERTLEEITGTDRSGISQYEKPSYLYSQLRNNAEFRVRFADHVHKHLFNDGALTPEKTAARYQELANFIDRAIVGESARWGDSSRAYPYTRDTEWLTERNRLLNYYFPQRTAIALGFFKNANLYPQDLEAPVFRIGGIHQHGGAVESNALLSMDNPNGSGTIYYCLDGVDPRVPAGSQIGSVQVFSERASKKVLVPTGNIGTAWRGQSEPYDDSGWTAMGSDNFALDFDGGNDCVTTGATASDLNIAGNHARTACAWVYTRSFNNGGLWDCGSFVEGQNFSLRTLETQNTWRVQHWGSPDIDFTYESLNTWVHFAQVYDGTQTRIYANGELVASEAHALNTSDETAFVIGRWGSYCFDGIIDDMRLYDAALDPAAIQTLIDTGSWPTGLVAHWAFDESGGTVAHDSQGNFDGALQGDPTWYNSGILGPGGVGYENNPGDSVNYTDLISLDVQSQMFNMNATCYIRIPFTLYEDPASLNFLLLNVRFDDGFIAYLNGTKIKQVNFNEEDTPTWYSHASNGHDDNLARQLISYKITDPNLLQQLRQGSNILAIHGLNVGTTSSDFLISAQMYVGHEDIIGQIISPSAQSYTETGSIPLTHSVVIKARVLSDLAQWSALNEAVYAVGPVAESLRITEIMYHPAGDPNAE
ncbi:MAG: CotH kinase family protein, partial [Sedimentisphaerales bacterium]|nr:CotH kinase family protein [Sedimentisphaerales bacterium]